MSAMARRLSAFSYKLPLYPDHTFCMQHATVWQTADKWQAAVHVLQHIMSRICTRHAPQSAKNTEFSTTQHVHLTVEVMVSDDAQLQYIWTGNSLLGHVPWQQPYWQWCPWACCMEMPWSPVSWMWLWPLWVHACPHALLEPTSIIMFAVSWHIVLQ